MKRAALVLLVACAGGDDYATTACIDIDRDVWECPEPAEVAEELEGRSTEGECTTHIQSVDDDGVRVGYDTGEGAQYRCCYPVSGTRRGDCGADTTE